MSLILGTNVLQKNEHKFTKISLCIMRDRKKILMEVGLPGAGECFTLIVKMPYFHG